MVHDIKASDYHYGFTHNTDNVFTNTTQDGLVNVYSISDEKVITLLGEGTLAGTTLTYDSVAYTRNDTLDDYYIDQSDIKFSSVDMAIFLKKLIDGQKVSFKKVSTFAGELGDLNTLYYLTTSYDNYKKGFYLYNGTVFYQIDYKSVKYVSTFNGIEGDNEALYYLDTDYSTYVKGFYRYVETTTEGVTTGEYVLIGHNQVVYLSTFTGVTGNTEKLYYLDTAYEDYKKGFYRYNGTNFVNINPKHFFIVSTFTGVEGDDEALYYLDTKYDTYKVGFYRFIPAEGGNPDRFVPIGRSLVKYVSTFNGEEGDTDVLYYLDTAYDDYKVGFYRYVEAQGATPAKFLLIGSASEVFTDVEELPETGISKDTIYRIQDISYEYQGQVIPKNEITWYGMGSDCLNMTADDIGLNIRASSGNRSYPWNTITDSLIQELEGLNLVAVDVPTADAVFFSHNTTYGSKDYLIEIQGDYHLYHNPTETAGEYLQIDGTETIDVFTDVETLPTSNISKNTIYRIKDYTYYLNDGEQQRVIDKPQAFKIINKSVVNPAQYGYTLPPSTTLNPWNQLQDSTVADWLNNNIVVESQDFYNTDFFKYGTNQYTHFTYVRREEKGYKLYHNPTQTSDGYLPLSTDSKEYVQYVSTFNNITNPDTSVLYYLTTAYDNYVVGFYRYIQGTPTGTFQLIGHNQVVYLSTFVGVNGNTEKLYYLDTDNQDYRKGFYRYSLAEDDFISLDTTGIIYLSTFNNVSGELDYLYYLDTQYTAASKTYKKGFYRYTERQEGGVTVGEFNLILEDKDWIQYLSTFTNVEGDSEVLYYLTEDYTAGTTKYIKGFYRYNEQSTLFEFIGTKVFEDVETLPTTNISDKLIYRQFVKRYTEDGQTLPSTPTGYLSTRPAIVIIDETGITDNGTHYAWEDITDEQMDFWVIRRQISQVYSADLMTMSTCFRTAANHYVYKTHVKYEELYVLYHNPEKAANTYLPLVDGFLHKLETTGLRAYTHADDVQGEMPIVTSIGDNDPTSQEVHASDSNLATELAIRKAIDEVQAIVDVTTLPTTNINTHSFYRVNEEYCRFNNTDYAPVTFYKSNSPTVEITTEGIISGGATTLWENVTDAFITSLGTLVQQTTSEFADFVKLDENLYNTIENATIVVAGLYHNPTATANNWILIDDVELEVDGITTEQIHNKIQANALIPVVDLPTEDIKQKSLYKISTTHYKDLVRGVDYTSVTFYKSADATITVDSQGIQEDGSPKVLWNNVTDTQINALVNLSKVEEVTDFGDAEFVRFDIDIFQYQGSVKEVKSGIYYNTDGTVQGWKLVGESGSEINLDEITTTEVQGKVQANAIIDAPSLPTTNIKINSIYRVNGTFYYHDGALLSEAPQGYNVTAQGLADNWSVTPDGLYWSEDGSSSQLYTWDYPSFIDTLNFEIGRGHFEEVQNFEDATFFKTGTTFDYYTKFAKEQKLTCFHKPTLASDWVELGSNVVPDEITVVFKNSKLKSNAILEVMDLPTANIQDRVLYWIPRDKYVVDGQPYYIAHGYKSIDPDVVVTTAGLEIDGTLTPWTSSNIISTIEELQSNQRILPGVPYLYCDFMWLEGNDWIARDKASIEYSEKGMYFNLDGTAGNWIQLDDSYSKEEIDHQLETIKADIKEDSERLDDVERVTSIALNELHDSITQGGIIDVTTLPTDNIKTNAIYRKKETVNYTANVFKHAGAEVNPKYLEKFGAKSGHTVLASSTGLKIDSNAVVAWASVSPSMTGWAAAVESLGYVSVNDNPDLTSTNIFYGYNNNKYDYAGSFAIENGVSKSMTLTKFFSYDGTTWTNMSTISLDTFQYAGLSDSQKMDNTVYIVEDLM